jgi:hypothetical protein
MGPIVGPFAIFQCDGRQPELRVDGARQASLYVLLGTGPAEQHGWPLLHSHPRLAHSRSSPFRRMKPALPTRVCGCSIALVFCAIAESSQPPPSARIRLTLARQLQGIEIERLQLGLQDRCLGGDDGEIVGRTFHIERHG